MKANKWFWGVVLAGIGLRVLCYLFQANPPGDDGLRYMAETINMIDYGVFSTSRAGIPSPSAHDMPLFPSVMAVFYGLTHSLKATQWLTGFLNILLVCGGVVLLNSLLKARPFEFSARARTAGVFLLLFMPESIPYSLFHMPDQMAVFFVVLMCWCYFRGCYLNPLFHIGTALASVAAIYSKPICIPLCAALLLALPFVQQGAVWKRVGYVVGCFLVIGLSLVPWRLRNERVFGTPGITSISGTNLYGCNWGRLVGSLPETERAKHQAEMDEFEATLTGLDLMRRSQLLGEYAQQHILSNLGDYAVYTLKKHPRLYAGTGTVSLFRYFGRDDICHAVQDFFGVPTREEEAVPYTKGAAFCGVAVQIVAYVFLLACYGLAFVGIVRGFRSKLPRLIYLCPILSLVLLAAVIGPVTATRYRYIMIPFFAILAAFALEPKKDLPSAD